MPSLNYDPEGINNVECGFSRFSTEDLEKYVRLNFFMRNCSTIVHKKLKRIIKVLKHRRRHTLF